MSKPNGYVVYRGPSKIDGDPIVMIATLNSSNKKTGDLIQTWVLRSDVDPIAAIYSNQDSTICGECVHRGRGNGKFRTCYVNVGQAPLGIFRAFQRGNYPRLPSYDIFRNHKVRLGAYGDPAAIPLHILDSICVVADNHTGYTHQWRTCSPEYKQYCMASVDTLDEQNLARWMGWRTFRVLSGNDNLSEREFYCPASPEGGDRLQCETCMACNGLRLGRLTSQAGSVAIKAHGKSWVPAILTKNLQGIK